MVSHSVGLVVSMTSIDELKHAIEEICSKGKEMYRQKCIAKVHDLYSLEKMTGQYYSLYKELMLNKRVIHN